MAESSTPKPKKQITLGSCLGILLVVFLVFLFIINLEGQNNTSTKTTPVVATIGGTPIYSVIHETGFYATLASTNPTDILSVGTLLKPANNAKFYDCEDTVDSGVTITLCHVELISSGKSGWVIQKWIARK